MIHFSAVNFNASGVGSGISASAGSNARTAPASAGNANSASNASNGNAGNTNNNPAAGNASPAPAPAPSLFAQVMQLSNCGARADTAAVTRVDTDAATDAASSNDEHKDAVAADIAAAANATPPVAGLPAMAAPVITLPEQAPPAMPAPASAAAGTSATTPAQVQTQINLAQSNPGLVLTMHPAAITLTGGAAPAGPDAREPIAAANPVATANPVAADAANSNTGAFKLSRAAAPANDDAAPAGTARTTPNTVATAGPGPAGGATRESGHSPEPLAAVTPGLNLASPAAGQSADSIQLNGPSRQWQAPLREALGDRLQTQVGNNSESATIRLDPPMLGRIDIAIRHTAGSLQVSMTASNTEVLRQLQNIGDNLRSDLAQRQYSDVSVNISATPRSPAAQSFAESDARGQRQPGRQQDDNEPGRALSDDDASSSTFAMYEREQH